MDLLKINLFKSGLFKQAKFFLSSPKRMHRALFVSETGVLSMETLPMATGYISATALKMSWLVVHQLKARFEGVDDPILEISERSYIPLDPFNTFTEEDKKKLLSLAQIAKIKYADKCAEITERNQSANTSVFQNVLTSCFLIIGLVLILNFVSC